MEDTLKKLEDGTESDTPGRQVNIGDRIIEEFVEDTYPGTTYDSAYHKDSEKDTDGLTLHTVTRFRDTTYNDSNS